ncbi:MAG: dephospho-CoA kinase [Clostridiales bacterium]|nr:dephospho-CoA kinase [Clostridiales bacterium]
MRGAGFKVVGLTGGIGSGKSTASAYLSARGYAVLDADKIAREVVAPGSLALGELVACFGSGILGEGGALDRKKLAGIVFTDKGSKERLDAIMHGAIMKIMTERIGELAQSGYDSIVFLDIPLLFETDRGIMPKMDEVWAVDADDEARVGRVTKRDGVSRQHVLNIMKNQAGREERRGLADVTIDNSGHPDELYRRLDDLIEKHELQQKA